MEYRNLGRSGLRVSLSGLGCNNFGGRIDLEASRAVVHKALDLGINLFDTADMYGGRSGSERCLGEILGTRRKDIVLASKFGAPMDDTGWLKGGSRRYIMSAVENSLTRLRTDWIDLYQFHFPDPLTPIEETLRALDDLVRQGKVRYLGLSNKPAWEVIDAVWTARSHWLAPLISCQDEYSLLTRRAERELIPAMRQHGLGLLPYYPLASGMLTGKYKRGEKPPEGTRFAQSPSFTARHQSQTNWDRLAGLETFAASHGKTVLELAFGWLASQNIVASVIAGATRPEQVAANIAAANWRLSADEMAQIDAISPPGG
ncbi:MAG: aldo/keto reductase [Alphaproteobacteria bacterium]|nr:aldo/keto reductase [Alphaproteobacteria bacterium]